MFVDALRSVHAMRTLSVSGPRYPRRSYYILAAEQHKRNNIHAIWGDCKNLTEQEMHFLRNEKPLRQFEKPTTILQRRYGSLYDEKKLPLPFYISPLHLFWELKFGQTAFRVEHVKKDLLSEVVVDNGVGNAKDLRRISIMQCIKLTPFMQSDKRRKFLPSVEELFLDCELVQKCVKAYTNGLLTSKKVYNAKHLIGEFYIEYDGKNPIKKNTPNGMIYCRYDNEGNLLEETLVELGLTRQYFYDRTGQRSEIQEVDSNGEKRIWRYKHTLDIHQGKIRGRCTEETDPDGRKTFRNFDLLGREVETRLPPIERAQGNPLERVVHRCYDLKNVWDVWNTPRNPDEHHEYMFYDTQGKMSSFGPHGVREFDNLGRLVKEKKFDKKKLINIIRYTYEGFLLVSEEHRAPGRNNRVNRWSYRHDIQGRLTQELWNNVLKYQYFHDTLGRITTKIDFTGTPHIRITNFVYDGPGVSPFACAGRGRSHEKEISIENHSPNQTIEIVKKRIDAWGREVSKHVIKAP